MKLSHAFKPPFKNLLSSALFAGVFLLVSLFFNTPAFADTVSELQSKIEERNNQLTALEAEIAKYEVELTKVGADRKTLEAEIARLDLSRKKIATDIAVTENRIATTDLQLEEIGDEIDDKKRRMENSTAVIQKSLRVIRQIEDVTLVEQFLASASLSEAWKETDQLRRVQTALGDEVRELTAIKEALEKDYTTAAKKQGELVSYKKELSGQKTVLDQSRQTQSSVLNTTKNKESEYQKLLNETREAQEQLETELRAFEAQLEYTLDPSKIPSPGSGVLQFPLDENFINRCGAREKVFGNLYCITQYFGNTAFARGGAYQGNDHNGTDFGAPEGTKVVSSLSGIVQAWGNTDAVPGCKSYGKWILIRHANGLSTLYAHLSHIGVEKGEAVATGQFIGYSGGRLGAYGSGYSTGSHLHFTVYASDGVQIKNLNDWYIENGKSTGTACARGGAIIPVAGKEAYLNPMSYL